MMNEEKEIQRRDHLFGHSTPVPRQSHEADNPCLDPQDLTSCVGNSFFIVVPEPVQPLVHSVALE